MDPTPFKRTEIAAAERCRMLDKLDHAEQARPKHPRRATPRVEYRVTDIPFTVNHPGGGIGRYIVVGRNLSTGGISLLNAGFVHPGSDCRLVLTLANNVAKALVGTVVFCRLVAGGIHEVGVRFKEKIDLSEFALPEAKMVSDDAELRELMRPLSGAALLVTPGAAQRRVLTACLNESGLDVTAVDNAGAGVDQVRLLPYLLAVCDMGLPDPGPGVLLVNLRGAGFPGPVIGTAGQSDADQQLVAAELGLQAFIGLPVRREDVQFTLRRALKACSVTSQATSPILSTLPPTPDSETLISQFVGHAQAVSEYIHQALLAGNAAAVQKECERLKSVAGGYGFQCVSEAARQALAAIDGAATLESASGRVKGLMEICSRLRARPSEPVR